MKSWAGALPVALTSGRAFLKVHALHHAAVFDVQTGNNTLGDHCATSMASRNEIAPV